MSLNEQYSRDIRDISEPNYRGYYSFIFQSSYALSMAQQRVPSIKMIE